MAPRHKFEFHKIIRFEDNHLLAVNKPQGMLVQGDRTGDMTLLDHAKSYIKTKYNKPGDVYLHPVHRIDRPVSGVVLLARTTKALSRLTMQFKQQEIKKTYWAMVSQKPKQLAGQLTHYMAKDNVKNKSTAFAKAGPGRKQAVLDYAFLGRVGNYYLLEIKPHTGRPHQIRVQLAVAGFPIVGDVKYGYPKPNPDQSVYLHARNISFVHPVKKEVILIQANPPASPEWRNVLSFLQA